MHTIFAMKIALIGADGQLGTDLLRTLEGEEIFPLYYPGFDITKPEEARKVLTEIRPDVVINTAAFHRVDECEDRVEEVFLVNAFAVRDLALACRDMDATLVHFSTDYVFDGRATEPYVEEDPPFPLSVYGGSKLAGEYFVRAISEKYFLIRTCGLYGLAGCREKGRNFVEAMLSLEQSGKPLRVVSDQWVTPTSAEELAVRVAELVGSDQFGLYHMTNEGRCTWHEFASAIFSYLGKKVEIVPVDSKSFGAKARRPAFSVLENKKAKAIGLADFSPWQEALKSYLRKKGLV
jgi:dTDP-4-dehydrorhamnose reductase